MIEGEDITDCISSRQRYGGSADDGGVDKCNGEQYAHGRAYIFAKSGSNATGIREVAELRLSLKDRCAEHHHCNGTDHDENDTQPEVGFLVTDEAWRDAFVDDIALLKEQLPRSDRRADNPDDKKKNIGQLAVRQIGNRQIAYDLVARYMRRKHDRNQQQATEAQEQREALETAKTARACRSHGQQCSNCNTCDLRDAEIVERQADADKFSNDRQAIEDEQIDDTESTPEFAEPFQNESSMANARHCAKAEHHFLVHIEDRHQKQQCPEQRCAVVLSSLSIGGESTGVIISDHDDQAGAEDRQQGE